MKNIVAFSGHMIDRLDRISPRFPPTLEFTIANRIRDELDRAEAHFGFASAACGADILFHEQMLIRGGVIHIVLPCPENEFCESCVDFIPGADWKKRFYELLTKAKTVEILSSQCATDNSIASECCNRVIAGLSIIHSKLYQSEPMLLAFWDGRPGDAIGGTQSMVEFCRTRGFKVNVIDCSSQVQADAKPIHTQKVAISKDNLLQSPQQIAAMVFADVVGYSKLTERQLPHFAKHFLGAISNLIHMGHEFPLAKNTWGDGLYLVFNSISAAGKFSLDLQHLVNSTDWSKHDLPKNLSIRISVHAGPVYRLFDPIISQWNYIGSQVTQTARLEPTTPPGRVFASRSFVALAEADHVNEFSYKYVGHIALAKEYGKMHAYELFR